MLTTSATTVVEERPRAQSRAETKSSHFLVRTSHFLKKFALRRKSESGEVGGVYMRSSRSMDVGPKPYMSHTVLHMRSGSQPRTVESDDAESGSPTPQRHSTSNAPTNGTSQFSTSRPSPQHKPLITDQPGPSNQADSRRSNGTAQRAPEGLPPSAEPPWTYPLIQEAFTRKRPGQANASPIVTSSSSPDNVVQQTGPSSGMSGRRELAPRLATLPPPMMAQYTTQGSARLTPSIVPRHPPMPLLNLPTLPPPTPAPLQRPPRLGAPLRSIPALPMEGPSDAYQDADHENAMLGDSDDEDGDGDEFMDHDHEADGRGGAASDDEDGEEISDMSSPGSEPQESRQPRLTRGSVSFVNVGSSTSAAAAAVQPPPPSRAGASPDYFTVKDAGAPRSQSPSRTPRPTDFLSRTPVLGGKIPAGLSPKPDGSPRPGMYHHASRSMVDLLSVSRKGKDKIASPLVNAADIQSYRKQGLPPAAPDAGLRSPRLEPSEDEMPASPTLRRQRSLPTYQASSDPPPYPSFHPRRGPVIQPREEEGREVLPPYSNSIYLKAILPRKMEFTAPGVMAKDRKWRRALCVLEGTAFRVYKCPPGAAGVSAIEEWWENKVGVGDITTTSSNAVTASGIRVSAIRTRDGAHESVPAKIAEESRSPSMVEQPPPESRAPTENGASKGHCPTQSRSRFHIASSLLHPSRSRDLGRLGASTSANSRSRLSMDDGSRPNNSAINSRRSYDASNSSGSAPSFGESSRTSQSTNTSPSSHEGTSLFSRTRLFHPTSVDKSDKSDKLDSSNTQSKQPEVPEPDPKDLARQYSLQYAESGLASDYSKRKNVIRVRFEGEQFLLQARDVAAVVDWIEGIQAGTNISLDLDARPMPKGPMFPRRRRRRPRRPDVQAAANNAR